MDGRVWCVEVVSPLFQAEWCWDVQTMRSARERIGGFWNLDCGCAMQERGLCI